MSVKRRFTGPLSLTGADQSVMAALTDTSVTREVHNLVVNDTSGAGNTILLKVNALEIERVVLAANQSHSFFPFGVANGGHAVTISTTGAVIAHAEYTQREGGDA